MKSAYIAIAVLAMIAAVVLLSGCTSGPATNATPNATLKPTKAPTSMPATSVGSVDSSAGVASALNATQWPEIRSGNNTSIINTSEGMKEVPNSMLAGNNTTKKSVESVDLAQPAPDASSAVTDAANVTGNATAKPGGVGSKAGNVTAKASPTTKP